MRREAKETGQERGQIETDQLTATGLAGYIDHSLLHPTLTDRELVAGCELGVAYRVAAVCVRSVDVDRARSVLPPDGPSLCSVVAFPHANARLEVIELETKLALDGGASEIDAPIPLSLVASKDWTRLEDTMARLTALVHEYGAKLKLIFETGLIADQEAKRKLCQTSSTLGVDFVKTSTGFATARGGDGSLITLGATRDDVALMVASVARGVKVKASGGIRSLAQAREFIELGASRLGTSSTEAIIQALREESEGGRDGTTRQVE